MKSLNVRAVLFAGILAGAGLIGLAIPLLAPARLLGGNVELVIGFVAVVLAFCALPGMLILTFMFPDHVLFNLIAAPLVSFVLYVPLFQGPLLLRRFMNRERKI